MHIVATPVHARRELNVYPLSMPFNNPAPKT
ncbi:hypothetical protein B0G62_1136 [Paraburkholderia eburnea]|uniref:Uncharacterized protein n=1 Tax=Paraburkholderia eburnea TaxID=1189126 RepID=A0A2S4M1Z2_9BURK|nr:hypothetical protein B0G62_1136 [Paraburkholderia eburnea]PRZ20836.1 hypothetical protein BX588_11070 [Paraburkholderia eburnea]